MAQKMLNPNTTLVVVPEANVVNPLAPTAVELNATTSLNISCAVTRGYTLNPTDSDTDDTASICDTGNVQNRLFDNYEGELTMFRDGNAADGASVFNIAFNYFKSVDQRFWVYRRLGKKSTLPFVDGDLIEGFLFVNDRTRSIDGGDSGPIQFTVPLLAQGTYTGYVNVGVVAAPTVTTLLPATGPITGGTAVTVTGTGFGSATGVMFGVQFVPASVVNGTTITVISPARGAGTANVRVVNPAGTSSTAPANLFTWA
jgi:hypothetical protein